MDKLLLQQQVCRRLADDLALLLAAAEDARQAATHEESKAENKYDTRGLEASYLAAGQARRAAEIRAALAAWQALQMRAYDDTQGIQLGALIWLGHAGGGRQRCTAAQRAAGAPQGRNSPAELPRIAQVLADVRGVPLATLAQQTTANALQALPRLQGRVK